MGTWSFGLLKGCLLPPAHPICALGCQAGLFELFPSFPSAGPGKVGDTNVVMGRTSLWESTVQSGQGLHGLSQMVSMTGSGCIEFGGAQKCLHHCASPGSSVLAFNVIEIRGPCVEPIHRLCSCGTMNLDTDNPLVYHIFRVHE